LVVTGLFSLRSQNWLRLLKSCTKVDDYAWSLARIVQWLSKEEPGSGGFCFSPNHCRGQASSTQCHL